MLDAAKQHNVATQKGIPDARSVLLPSAQDAESFRKLWLEEFNEEISLERACDEAMACLRLVQLAYRPMKPGDRALLQEKRTELVAGLCRGSKKDTKVYTDNKLRRV